MRRVTFAALAVCVIGASGCSINKDLVKRASFDLDCPESELSVTELGSMGLNAPRGVRGCGRRATYLYDGDRGRWVMNSPRVEHEAIPLAAEEVPASLVTQASADLTCDAAGVTVKSLTTSRWSAAGCGRFAKYRFDDRTRRWLLTQPIQDEARGILGSLRGGGIGLRPVPEKSTHEETSQEQGPK